MASFTNNMTDEYKQSPKRQSEQKDSREKPRPEPSTLKECSFMFVGQTDCGKADLVRSLTRYLGCNRVSRPPMTQYDIRMNDCEVTIIDWDCFDGTKPSDETLAVFRTRTQRVDAIFFVAKATDTAIAHGTCFYLDHNQMDEGTKAKLSFLFTFSSTETTKPAMAPPFEYLADCPCIAINSRASGHKVFATILSDKISQTRRSRRRSHVCTNSGEFRDLHAKLGRVSTTQFPLSNNQLTMLANTQFRQKLDSSFTKPYSAISIEDGVLTLTVPEKVPNYRPVYLLHKRLGTLLTVDEIEQIRQEMPNSIDAQLNNQQFFDKMMRTVGNGVRFTHHAKVNRTANYFLQIRKDRLYWKRTQQDPDDPKKSIRLDKIIDVQFGKYSNSLRALHDVDEDCCFVVVSKKRSLYLSSPTKDPIAVHTFAEYLCGLMQHFKSHTLRFKESYPNKKRMSPIGQGFPGFRFDTEAEADSVVHYECPHISDDSDQDDRTDALPPLDGIGEAKSMDDDHSASLAAANVRVHVLDEQKERVDVLTPLDEVSSTNHTNGFLAVQQHGSIKHRRANSAVSAASCASAASSASGSSSSGSESSFTGTPAASASSSSSSGSWDDESTDTQREWHEDRLQMSRVSEQKEIGMEEAAVDWNDPIQKERIKKKLMHMLRTVGKTGLTVTAIRKMYKSRTHGIVQQLRYGIWNSLATYDEEKDAFFTTADDFGQESDHRSFANYRREMQAMLVDRNGSKGYAEYEYREKKESKD